jgi:hypothetical protein
VFLLLIGIKIKYEYNDIKGFAVWLKASQVKAFQKDKKVDSIGQLLVFFVFVRFRKLCGVLLTFIFYANIVQRKTRQ